MISSTPPQLPAEWLEIIESDGNATLSMKIDVSYFCK